MTTINPLLGRGAVEAELAVTHLNAAALARREGWSVKTVYNRRANGGDLPPSISRSGRPRWRLSDVIAWENAQIEAPRNTK